MAEGEQAALWDSVLRELETAIECAREGREAERLRLLSEKNGIEPRQALAELVVGNLDAATDALGAAATPLAELRNKASTR